MGLNVLRCRADILGRSTETVEVAIKRDGAGGGGGRLRHQSSSPSSRPPELNNPTSADHSVTASDLVKDFTKVFTEPAEPRGPLNYAYGLLLKTGLITIVCSLLFLHRERQHNIEKQMVNLFFSFLLITDIMHSVHLAL